MPVSDDSMQGDQPTYRDLWLRIREQLPKQGAQDRGRSTKSPSCRPSWKGRFRASTATTRSTTSSGSRTPTPRPRGSRRPSSSSSATTPTSRSSSSTTSPAGRKPFSDGEAIVVPGQLPLFNNEQDGAWSPRPNTILVDSEQLESGEGMSAEFKKIAAREIEEFKAEYRARFPGRDADEPDRRRPAPRGHEHRRQARQARRARQVRRQRLDAHRGLGRQHRHPRPRRPGLRHAAPLRAGRRPRPCGG